jgi:hypothetical protein
MMIYKIPMSGYNACFHQEMNHQEDELTFGFCTWAYLKDITNILSAEASQKFLRDVDILPKLFNYEHYIYLQWQVVSPSTSDCSLSQVSAFSLIVAFYDIHSK